MWGTRRYNFIIANAEGDMEQPRFPDTFDWHGCEAVQFDPAKLGGRATVGNTRMDFESGLSVDEIVESFGVERRAVEQILAFAASRQLQRTA
jgi:uncharacterized protein (DUF433 family)